MDDYLTKNVVLETVDYNYIQKIAEIRGLGRKGFSAALRMIVREHPDFPSPSGDNGDSQNRGETK